MAEFFAAFLSGSWLVDFWSWIWSFCVVGGTKGLWSLYVMTWGHAGLLWWLWALVVLIVVLWLIACLWFLIFVFLFCPWVGCLLAWLFVWTLVLIWRIGVWLAILLWHIGCWIWPFFLLFLKAFMLPAITAFALIELRKRKDWKKWLFYILCPAFLVGLFFVFPVKWAIWFFIITSIYLWFLQIDTSNTPTLSTAV